MLSKVFVEVGRVEGRCDLGEVDSKHLCFGKCTDQTVFFRIEDEFSFETYFTSKLLSTN